MSTRSWPHTAWKWLCSLKLAIVLASLATLLGLGGALLIPFNPAIFGGMDGMPLGRWLATFGSRHLGMTWWLWLGGALILLLGINTACCFIDWLRNLRARWRKTGEYLIHLGFVLLLGAYLWGSLAGFRSEGTRIAVGETIAISNMPGYSLRLDAFEPIMNSSGRPVDMRNELTLLKGESVLVRKVVKTNQPLTWRGLAVLAASFDQDNDGFLFDLAGQGRIELRNGSRLALADGGQLSVRQYLPHAIRLGNGQVVAGGNTPVDPALLCEITRPGQAPRQQWYFLRGPLPQWLTQSGLRLIPRAPVYSTVSILTVNRDPGAAMAMAGAAAMTAGVVLAMLSFYYKRGRGDRPSL
ncbi:cytochrome c biogenesis protein ResB [Trichloromonas sp.]|uniref:cytochrome c biogenesis protein ResB n=1 Tax=Trichloromonas sp. TaxID=3069249 RepID=UPI003D813034